MQKKNHFSFCFQDEVRCPVHVLDVVGAVQGVISKFGKLGDHKHLPVERVTSSNIPSHFLTLDLEATPA